MKISPGFLLIGAGVALWVIEQNRIYQDSANRIANASKPVGQLANTLDRYMPTIVDAWDYYAHK